MSLTAGTGRSAGEVLEETSGIVSLLPVLIGPNRMREEGHY